MDRYPSAAKKRSGLTIIRTIIIRGRRLNFGAYPCCAQKSWGQNSAFHCSTRDLSQSVLIYLSRIHLFQGAALRRKWWTVVIFRMWSGVARKWRDHYPRWNNEAVAGTFSVLCDHFRLYISSKWQRSAPCVHRNLRQNSEAYSAIPRMEGSFQCKNHRFHSAFKLLCRYVPAQKENW